jgi:hypothetical protein
VTLYALPLKWDDLINLPNSNATSSDAVAGGCLSSPRLLNT